MPSKQKRKRTKIIVVYTPLGYLSPEAYEKLDAYGMFDKMKRRSKTTK